MTKAQTMWVAVLVLSASCLAAAEQPVVWYPAQQVPETQSSQTPSGQAGQQPTTDTGQQPSAQPPAQQPGTQSIQPGIQPVQPGVQPGAPANNDPRADQPMQPIAPAESSSAANQPTPATAPMVPDTTPLNSPQQLTLGTESGGGRNYFIPSLRFTQYGMLSTGTGTGGWDATPVTNLSGTAVMSHSWSRANLRLDYTGGGTLFLSDSSLNSGYQQAGLQYAFTVNRWNLSLTDQASYLPESAFGYFGLGMGGINTGLGNQYLPNQSILTNTTRLSNTAASTASYRLSAKSTIHFSGTFGILRFQGGGGPLVNSNSFSYSAGYDRTFGRNTLGLSYAGSMYTYGGSDESIRTDGVNVAFGRRITGRLAWQVAGGPQVRTVNDPVLGTDTGASWNLNTGLTYQIGRLLLNSSFSRNTTAGAGVFVGTETYQWMAGVSRPVGRQWSGGANFGIARNTSLQQASLATTHLQTEFVSVQVSRVVSREASLFVSYNFQHQAGDLVICPGCGDTFDRHVFGAGFQWQGRPLAFNPF